MYAATKRRNRSKPWIAAIGMGPIGGKAQALPPEVGLMGIPSGQYGITLEISFINIVD